MSEFASRLRLSEDPNDNSLEYRRGWNAALREVDRITRAAAPHSDAAQPSARETAFVTTTGEQLYPCLDCDALRTKAEGGTTFTVCDACWDKRVVTRGEAKRVRPVSLDLPEHDACDCEACRAAKGCECTEVPCAAFCPARDGK